jgi:ubiquinone/menaquinone biosynthesis C-methylase UbiE
MDQHGLAAHQFGFAATRYLTSAVHASGADLERLVDFAAASRPSRMLDLGCGAGHVSFALARGGAQRVIAYDLALPMLEVVAAEAATRGHDRIETVAGPAERLSFADSNFDAVVTRYSAHHWLDVGRALHEVARVLKPGGKLIVVDIVAPESPLLDTSLQTVEILRDSSHVRDYRASEWRAMLDAAGFDKPRVDQWKLPMEFHSWVARSATPPARVQALKTVFDALPAEARDYFRLADDYSFAIDAGWFETAKRCHPGT